MKCSYCTNPMTGGPPSEPGYSWQWNCACCGRSVRVPRDPNANTLLLEIPAGIRLVDVCEFARANGCSVQRLRNGIFRLNPDQRPPPPPMRSNNVINIQEARR